MAYDAVDTQGGAAQELVDHMVAADEHPGVVALRTWTAAALALTEGGRAVDVGRGPGTAAALAALVGPDGRVLGIDASAVMVEAATAAHAEVAGLAFLVGDALALDLDDDAVDAYRSERTFQYLTEPERAWAEAVRVVRPGGRVAVTDTDWGTLTVDHPDEKLTHRLLAVRRPFPQNPWSGRRL